MNIRVTAANLEKKTGISIDRLGPAYLVLEGEGQGLITSVCHGIGSSKSISIYTY